MDKKNLIVVIAVAEIILILGMTFSNGYTLGQNFRSEKIVNSNDGKFKEILGKSLDFMIDFFSIKELRLVSAEEIEMHCCPELKNGGLCIDIPSTESSKCKVEPLATECENTNTCSIGCCVGEEGLCSTNAPKGECLSNNGLWKDDESCTINECQVGCCVSTGYEIITENACAYFSEEAGVEKDFRAEITTQQGCSALKTSSVEGACAREGFCFITTHSNCVSNGGDFFEDEKCSNPQIESDYNYDYEPEYDKTCFEDNIYWEDSQGNIEELAVNGGCLEQNKKCDYNSNGDAYCKELSCQDDYFENKFDREPENGESWCIYDGRTGEGKDPVGSEHYIAHCFEGEVSEGRPYELTSSYRKKICAERILQKADGTEFVTAEKVVNLGSQCNEYGIVQVVKPDRTTIDNTEALEACKANEHCDIEGFYVDEEFQFFACIPKHPVGSDLNDDGIDDGLCSFKQTCKVIYKKGNNFDDWDPIGNKECEKDVFAERMNDFCTARGDCGSYINYIGYGSDNIEIIPKKGHKIDDDGNEEDEESSGWPCVNGMICDYEAMQEYMGREGIERIDAYLRARFCTVDLKCGDVSWEDYKENKNPSDDDHGTFLSFERVAGVFGFDASRNLNGENPEVIGKISKWLGHIPGSLGALRFIPGVADAKILSISLGSVSAGLIGFSTGFFAATVLTEIFGTSGTAALVAQISGGVSGAVGLLGGSPFGGAFLGVVGPALFWVGIAALIGSLIVGGPSYETRYVEFNCMPWAPPAGGENCHICNEDPLRPCTEYRCESLGALCQFLDDSSSNPPCVAMEPENNPPVISPGQILTPGFEFAETPRADVAVRKTNDGCVVQGDSVQFSLNTDENAQCLWSFERPESAEYNKFEEEGGRFFVEGNQWVKNHTLDLTAPRIDGLKQSQVTETSPNRQGKVNVYVKCQDAQKPNNFNFDNYVVEFCVDEKDTEKVDYSLMRFEPENGFKLKFGTTYQEVNMWTNKPADCRYDFNAGIRYENMENPFGCVNGLDDKEVYGWRCTTNLTNLQEGNNIYIKCKDQPWLAEDDSNRNTNLQDKKYTLYLTQEELGIEEIKFEYEEKEIESGGVFREGFEPISVEMKVKTSGGVDGGASICYWRVSESGSRDQMEPYDVYVEGHTKTLSPRFEGTYNNYVECFDEAGNSVSATANFTVEIDAEAPAVTRVFRDGNYIKFFTNEEAKCYYSLEDCGFNLDEGNSITSSLSLTHKVAWNPDKLYYIKCEDQWERANSGCALIVKASEI